MRRWTAIVLVLPLIGLAALLSNAQGRQWVREAAVEQVDDVLDAVALTRSQRAALEDFKNQVAARLEARIAQFGDLVRRVWRPRSYECQLRSRFHVVALPGNDAVWVQVRTNDDSHAEHLDCCKSVARRGFSRPLPYLISAPAPAPKPHRCNSGWNRAVYRAPSGCNALDCGT